VDDPWYDYLAIPVAPLLLLVQVGALFIRPALWRWAISLACTAAIAGMLFYVESRPVAPDEGVNIGAGVLVLWLVVSVALLAVGVAREVIALTVREFRAERRSKGAGRR
jgi:4-amino-4-deoxy-L-arabinose transferase-like glycosyltransferase